MGPRSKLIFKNADVEEFSAKFGSTAWSGKSRIKVGGNIFQ